MQAKEKRLVFGRFTQANNVALGTVTKISNLTHFHKSHLKLKSCPCNGTIIGSKFQF